MTFSQHHGFIALMSVVIISAILLVLIFTLGTASFFQRFDALDAENKRISLGLAEACVNVAMLKMAQSDFTTAHVVVDAGDPKKICEICKLSPSGDILTRAVYNSAYTNLSVTVDSTQTTYPIIVWSETGIYTGPFCPFP